jgi:methionyl-tRNA formyltransferase
MPDSIRIVYAGTPDFAVPALKQCCEAGYDVVGVYTQPDRPAGRGRELKPSPVKQFALENHLPVFQPESFRADEHIEELKQLKPDLMVVAAYGLLLPEVVLNIPGYGCINVHASLLPRWRGAAPIQRAIIAGDRQTGITIMQMNEGLDTGDMLLHKSCDIGEDETASSLHDRLMVLGGDALLEVLPKIISGQFDAVAQTSGQVTYAKKLTKKEAEIDWSLSAIQIQRCVRAYNAWPVAFTHWQKDKKKSVVLRVWEADILEGEISSAGPGSVVNSSRDGIDVATGDGVLRLTSLQAPGKQRVSAADFSNAYQLADQIFGQHS